jgi:UDP-N-acetylmuramate dehydrogenase
MQVQKRLPEIQKNIPLKIYTTFKIGGKARYFFEAKNKEETINSLKVAKELKLPFFILGGGSNLLVSDKGFKGLVIKVQSSKLKIQSFNSYFKFIAEAGIPLAKIVSESLKIGATGFEWAAGIPGTVGGAVRGNAGAFSKSMNEVVKKVEAFDLEKNKIRILKNKDCNFFYKSSVFKKNKNLVVLSVILKFAKGDKKKIRTKIKKYLDYRREKHPVEPSAGSIFKNIPSKNLRLNFFKKFPEAKKVMKENFLPVAFLIDQCGLKGKRIGGAMISKKHPNFIINYQNAKAKDVIRLISLIKREIEKKFGIQLEEEIEYLGFPQLTKNLKMKK